MSAILVVSPTPKLVIGQALQLRCQVRDSEVRRAYDLTGAGAISTKLVSLTGGTPRACAAAGAMENAPNATFGQLISAADSNTLVAGRWYLQVTIATVPSEGGGPVIPDLFPFDAVASQ